MQIVPLWLDHPFVFSDDNVVELLKPLGLILNQDANGNVYVETVAPKGNAARSGKVKEGDIVTMCSATFGDEMWSTRGLWAFDSRIDTLVVWSWLYCLFCFHEGVGLTRVLAAIRVRSGNTVKLVLESPDQYKKKAEMTTKQRKAMEEAREAAQAKKDQLLAELEKDEERLKSKKFFGLF